MNIHNQIAKIEYSHREQITIGSAVLRYDGSGKKVNIGVQRADNDDRFRRARFNASSITVKDSNLGDRFDYESLHLYD